MRERLEKYTNALRYGDKKTKQYLWAIIVSALCALVFFVLACVFFSWKFALCFLFFGILAVIIWQSRSLTDDQISMTEETAKETKQQKKEKEQSGPKKQNSLEEQDSPEEQDRSEEEQNSSKEEDSPKRKNNSEEEQDNLKEEDSPKEQKEVEKKPEDYSRFTEKVIEQTLHKYKVKRIHKTVMIDSCPSKHIKECPAYIWRDKKNLYFLLLEDTPRRIEMDIRKVYQISYVRGVVCNPDKEYTKFQKKSIVTGVFSEYLPDYYKDVKIIVKKNLYVLEPDISFTNTSARNVFEIVGAGFHLEDKITREREHNGFFIEGYQLNVLWRDGVLDSKEYKEKIKELLRNMAQSDLAFDDFRKTIEQLTRYRFITEEFADFYMDYRKKWKEKQNMISSKQKRLTKRK